MKSYEKYKQVIKGLFSLIILSLIISIYTAVWTLYFNRIIEAPFWRKGNWLMAALYGILLMFFFKTYGGFKIGYLKRGNLIWSQILSVIWVNIITYLQICLLDKRFLPPTAMLLMTFISAVLIILWAILFQWLYEKLFPPKQLLLVYGDRPTYHLTDKINSREDKYYLAGAIHIKAGINKIMEKAQEYDAVIIGDIPASSRNLLLKTCFCQSIRTYSVPKISDILIRTSSELDIFDSPLLLSRNDSLHLGQRLIKRVMDIAFSFIGLILGMPLFLIISILITWSDRGPIFYKQDRLTIDGKIFKIYKFRTMIQDAEKGRGAVLATYHDDRIFPIGNLLRKTRLDELPQLWNIFKGEMSLVGPRPERPELAAEVERELPEFVYRLKVKAGLTGYAQIYGKYNTTAYDKLKLDLTYIRNYSFFMDLKLLLMTPKIMLLKESAEGVKEMEDIE